MQLRLPLSKELRPLGAFINTVVSIITVRTRRGIRRSTRGGGTDSSRSRRDYSRQRVVVLKQPLVVEHCELVKPVLNVANAK
jgi:hypothetical protein